MDKKKLILHVGLPKTGSTALQMYLNLNRELIASRDFSYPKEKTKKGIPKHQSLVRGLNSNNHTNLKNYLQNNSKNNLILSTEGLTNHLYDFSFESVLEFKNILNTYELTIIIVTREFDNWLKSYYAQSVINPRIKLSYNATALEINEFSKHPRIQQLGNINQVIKDLKLKFGATTVIRLKYSKNLVKDFCNTIRIPYIHGKIDRVNESPKPWTIELMRQINGFETSENERSMWRSVIQEFSLSNHSLMQDSLNTNQNEKKLSQTVFDSLVYKHSELYGLKKKKLEEFKKFIYLKNYL